MKKFARQSDAIMTQIVLHSHINGSGRLFGGQLMSWMDITGAICAKRHAECNVVTARVDRIDFFYPAMPNDIVVVSATICGVGNTSMKVCVSANVENFSNKKETKKICSATFTFVAIDENGKKYSVPKLADLD